jgi:hypothetical protein
MTSRRGHYFHTMSVLVNTCGATPFRRLAEKQDILINLTKQQNLWFRHLQWLFGDRGTMVKCSKTKLDG